MSFSKIIGDAHGRRRSSVRRNAAVYAGSAAGNTMPVQLLFCLGASQRSALARRVDRPLALFFRALFELTRWLGLTWGALTTFGLALGIAAPRP